MTEKVKLPKEVCDALDTAISCRSSFYILEKCHYKKWSVSSFSTLNNLEDEKIMRALVLGYEPELSAEEQIKDLYYCPPEYRESSYRQGIRDALRIHGIHYDWLTDQND